MNAARPHTDGERHNGDTTRDFAASIYLIQNQDRLEEEWDPLPDNLTADDVVRALARQKKRREELRAAIEATGTKLRTPMPLRPHTPADQRIDNSEDYTGRVPFWYVIVLLIAAGFAAVGIYSACVYVWGLL